MDIDFFLSEIFRVATKGYIEYPVIYYDYIYNFPEHLTFLKLNHGKLFYLPKAMTPLLKFSEVNMLFYESLKSGHYCLVDALKDKLFEGFEWNEPFEIKKTDKISDLCWANINIKPYHDRRIFIVQKFKAIFKRLLKCSK